jgi:nitrate/nitrite transporter NarK
MAGCLSGGFATDVLVRKCGLVWGRRLPGMLSGLGAATALGVCMGLDHVLLIILMLSCVYFLADLFLGTTWSTYQDIGGAHVGSILGFANMCGNLGAALSIEITSRLAKNGQWTSVFAMSCGAFVVATLCWFWIDPRVAIVNEQSG